MSLYLAKKVPDAKNAPAAFLAKKLNGLAPSPINQLAVIGISKYPEVAYGMYRQNIDAFCFATWKKEKTFAQAEAFDDIMVEKITLPVKIPVLAFSPAAKLTPDQGNTLLQKLGAGSSMRTVGKTTEYEIPVPQIYDITKYIKASNPNFSTGPDRLSPLGFRVFVKAITLIEVFLATNYYPAFKSLTSEVPQSSEMLLKMAGESDGKKKEYFYAYSDGLKRDSDQVVDSNSILRRRKMARVEEEDEETDEMDTDEPEEVYKGKEKLGAMTFGEEGIRSSVIVAKPSGRPASVNYGPPGAVPALPGIVFPYFHGLNQPDFVTIREVFVQHFIRLFGDNFADCKRNVLELKKGANNLCNTRAGMEVTHMMKGQSLSLQTQTRLFLIFDTEYRGFVLLGAHFSVFDGSKWIDPVSPEDVKTELDKMDTHLSAVTEICSLLSDMEVSPGITEEVTPQMITSATALLNKMHLRDFEGYKKADEFDRNLQCLIWKRPYTQLNPDNFITFLTAYFQEISFPPDDTPIYIPSCKVPAHDRLFRWLGTFGPDAPSLWNSRGDIISVVPELARKGEEVVETQVTVPKEIIMIPKPLLVALKDWKERIIEKGAVAFNFKERAKEHRAHVVTKDAVRGKIWEILRKGLLAIAESKDGQPEKKKKKQNLTVVVEAEDVLSLW